MKTTTQQEVLAIIKVHAVNTITLEMLEDHICVLSHAKNKYT